MACCPYTAESLSLGADQPVCSHLDRSFSRCTQTCNGEGREVAGPDCCKKGCTVSTHARLCLPPKQVRPLFVSPFMSLFKNVIIYFNCNSKFLLRVGLETYC